MTTIDGKSSTRQPPVGQRAEPPVGFPPPPPRGGRISLLWPLLALIVVVGGIAAVALVVEDDGPAYVDTETFGRPGALLEIQDLSRTIPVAAATNVSYEEAAAADRAMLNNATVSSVVTLEGAQPRVVSVHGVEDRSDLAMLTTAFLGRSMSDGPVVLPAADLVLLGRLAWSSPDVTVAGLGTPALGGAIDLSDVAMVNTARSGPVVYVSTSESASADVALLNTAIWRSSVGPTSGDTLLLIGSLEASDVAMLNSAVPIP